MLQYQWLGYTFVDNVRVTYFAIRNHIPQHILESSQYYRNSLEH